MIYYRINIHARRKVSIDEVDRAGRYICQCAFYFSQIAEAKARLEQILAEDVRTHHASQIWTPPTHEPTL